MKTEIRNPKSEGRPNAEVRKISVARVWFGLLVLAVLAGCKVGPDYKRPQVTTIPTAYTGATNVVGAAGNTTNAWKVAQPQAQLPKGNWWEIFGDAKLNELESQSSAANQQLKIAVSRLAEARAQMNVTRAGLFPNITGGGS
ncbi:MAG TPA: hypothetical protein VGI88_10860, partial [Verrucomicrobiae bacterium]